MRRISREIYVLLPPAPDTPFSIIQNFQGKFFANERRVSTAEGGIRKSRNNLKFALHATMEICWESFFETEKLFLFFLFLFRRKIKRENFPSSDFWSWKLTHEAQRKLAQLQTFHSAQVSSLFSRSASYVC